MKKLHTLKITEWILILLLCIIWSNFGLNFMTWQFYLVAIILSVLLNVQIKQSKLNEQNKIHQVRLIKEMMEEIIENHTSELTPDFSIMVNGMIYQSRFKFFKPNCSKHEWLHKIFYKNIYDVDIKINYPNKSDAIPVNINVDNC